MTSDKELALAINRMENLLEVMKIKLKNAKDEKEAKEAKQAQQAQQPKPRGRPVLYKTPEELKEASQRYSKTHYLNIVKNN